MIHIRTAAAAISDTGHRYGLCPAILGYDPARPYTTTVVFRSAVRTDVHWIFGRDLLADGIDAPSTSPAGLMDVRVWRMSALDVGLLLASGGELAILALPAVDVRRYLRRTYALVPRGAESQHLDLDQAIADLLDGAR